MNAHPISRSKFKVVYLFVSLALLASLVAAPAMAGTIEPANDVRQVAQAGPANGAKAASQQAGFPGPAVSEAASGGVGTASAEYKFLDTEQTSGQLVTPSEAPAGLSPQAWASIREQMRLAQYQVTWQVKEGSHACRAPNRAQGFDLAFAPDGFSVATSLHASDMQADDRFGNSVSISGDTLVVGAPWEDGGAGDPASAAGAAYIFKLVKLLEPELQSLNPVSNTHTAPLTTTVSATYDQDMDAATVSTRTFAVHAMQTGLLASTYGVTGGTIILTPTYGVNGGTIILTPTNPFFPGELVQATATTGTLSISGTAPLSSTVWQFRTAVLSGAASFIDSGQPLGISNSLGVSLGDIDGDGDLDAVVANDSGQAQSVWVNDGGVFSLHPTTPAFGAGNTWDVALGDLDGDGDLDAVVLAGSAGMIEAWVNDGGGNFTAHPTTPSFGSALWYRDANLGDIDGDGDLDLIAVDYDNSRVCLNDGAGNFSAHPTNPVLNIGPNAHQASGELGDLDGDGDLDLLITREDGRWERVWFNDGTGVYTTLPTSPDFEAAGVNNWDVALGDVDGDGDLDAFIVGWNNHSVWLNDGAGAFSDSGQSLSHSYEGYGVELGDLDGDGDLDAFVATTGGGQVWLNDGTGTLTDGGRNLGSADSRGLDLGDLNGDGGLDAFVANHSGQANRVWLNRLAMADVTISKAATPATAAPGQPITYTLVFTNNGPEAATGVIITDTIPVSVTNTSVASSGAAITQTAPGYVWDVAALAPGAGGIITITGTLSDPLAVGTFTNMATITGTVVDAVTINNRSVATVTITVVPLPSLTRCFATIVVDGTTTIFYSSADASAVQQAVDAAGEGDLVKVAGYCAGWQARPVPAGYENAPADGLIVQTLYVSKTVSLQGGYTTTNWTTPDPQTNPTTLDAQAAGRPLFISGDITPTIQGLRLTGGNAAGLGGHSGRDVGGGGYILTATATLSSNIIISNTAAVGGGLFVVGSDAVLSGNTIISNTTTAGGGGLALKSSPARLSGNKITFNATSGGGGGLLLITSTAMLSGNMIISNIATAGGGGLALVASPAILSGNTITSNTATAGGGGLILIASPAALTSNTITSNTATAGGGGGLYAIASDARLSGNTITSNTATAGGGLALESSNTVLSDNKITFNTTQGSGGGLYASSSVATLSSNKITTNTATFGGGGLYVISSAATLSGNDITSNAASTGGGGLYVISSTTVLSDNKITSNAAPLLGGGLYVISSTARLDSNEITSNAATAGGGLYVISSAARLSDNTITFNTATAGGGGLALESSDARLSGNNITFNTTQGGGGGLYIVSSPTTLSGNKITSNTATSGGGLALISSTLTLTNTVVVDNSAGGVGAGLYVESSSPRLVHTTLACNNGIGPGDGSGLFVVNGSNVALANTILVSHAVGINLAAGSTASLNGVLWYGNQANYTGDVTVQNEFSGDPAFVAAGAGNYDIGPDSAAIDRGVEAGVPADIEGRPRVGQPDLGAYEYQGAAPVYTIYLPVVLRNFQ